MIFRQNGRTYHCELVGERDGFAVYRFGNGDLSNGPHFSRLEESEVEFYSSVRLLATGTVDLCNRHQDMWDEIVTDKETSQINIYSIVNSEGGFAVIADVESLDELITVSLDPIYTKAELIEETERAIRYQYLLDADVTVHAPCAARRTA